MKRLMSVLFIAVLFASCSSDDDKNSDPSIVGNWTLVELNAENPIDFNNDGIADRNIMNEIPCYEGHASFSADGNYLITLSNITGEEVNGVLVIECDGNSVDAGTYVLNGDQLTTNPNNPEEESSTTTIVMTNNTVRYFLSAGDLGQVEFVARRN